MLKAIFFDFDGVIADSEPLHLRAYQEVLGREGIALDKTDYYAKYLGYDDVGLFEALADDRGLDVTSGQIESWIAEKSRIMEAMLASDSILFPGAASCVRRLAAIAPLAVASGALEPEIEIVLRHAGLRDCFTAIASASDGVRGKPEPDLYLLAMAKLSGGAPVEPGTGVAIEDSRWGLEAAKRAGLRCIAVTHTYPESELRIADLIVDSLEEITADRVAAVLGDNGQAG